MDLMLIATFGLLSVGLALSLSFLGLKAVLGVLDGRAVLDVRPAQE